MSLRIANVQIWHPGTPESEFDEYWRDGEGGRLSAMYGELLGMRRVNVGYMKLTRDGAEPEIGFENGRDDERARWPDSERPQQVHLDIAVGDLDAAEQVVLRHGAQAARDHGEYRIYIDQVGHPFCLYLDESGDELRPARLVRVVFDCFSPRALASFYEQLLGFRTRIVDTAARVEIRGDDDSSPILGFQYAVFPASRWPDPRFPAQLHLDLVADDVVSERARIEALGGILLRRKDSHDVFGDPSSHPFCLGPPEG